LALIYRVIRGGSFPGIKLVNAESSLEPIKTPLIDFLWLNLGCKPQETNKRLDLGQASVGA